jgi:hypothetical protein
MSELFNLAPEEPPESPTLPPLDDFLGSFFDRQNDSGSEIEKPIPSINSHPIAAASIPQSDLTSHTPDLLTLSHTTRQGQQSPTREPPVTENEKDILSDSEASRHLQVLSLPFHDSESESSNASEQDEFKRSNVGNPSALSHKSSNKERRLRDKSLAELKRETERVVRGNRTLFCLFLFFYFATLMTERRNRIAFLQNPRNVFILF